MKPCLDSCSGGLPKGLALQGLMSVDSKASSRMRRTCRQFLVSGSPS